MTKTIESVCCDDEMVVDLLFEALGDNVVYDESFVFDSNAATIKYRVIYYLMLLGSNVVCDESFMFEINAATMK